jgi:hypothetical protein
MYLDSTLRENNHFSCIARINRTMVNSRNYANSVFLHAVFVEITILLVRFLVKMGSNTTHDKEDRIKPKTVLSEKVIFRLTTDEYQRLVERAACKRRSLSNLVWLLVSQALRQDDDKPSADLAAGTPTDTTR